MSAHETLPSAIGLARHAPNRRAFSTNSFNPSNVRSVSDLPPYLILGELDRAACQFSNAGWNARWQGCEDNTHFDVRYKAMESRFEIQQTWQGYDGGFSTSSASIPLSNLIGEALYAEFPSSWDDKAKEILQNRYQLAYMEHPKRAFSICYMPDGAFRMIALPIGIRNLRHVSDCLYHASTLGLPFSFNAYTCPLIQVVNYVEGQAPDWTSSPEIVFNSSVNDTGLIPRGLPVRENAEDGTAAWTLRREFYVIFIDVPFAGLTQMLELLRRPDGPLRYRTDPDLTFDLQPVVFPHLVDLQAKSTSF
jgi:hypothetical protein